jgi:phosphoribosylaminoimidazole (AIR) synthetase
VGEDEMNRVFNMGIGMIVAVAPGDVTGVCGDIPEAIVVGDVVSAGDGPQVVIS